VEIKYYKDAADFLAHTGEYLAQDEARYGLINGIARVVEKNPRRYGQEDPWVCSVGDGRTIVAAALRTPPYMVITAYFSGDINAAAEKLMSAVFESFKVIPGVIGDKELADIFAGLWCEKHGTKIKFTQGQKIYRLVKVNDVPQAPGRVRVAALEDKDLVKQWAHAFHVDVGGEIRHAPEGDPTPGLEQGAVFFWEDSGRPVSMAVKGRPTDKGMTVGYVYTPPELRGKGYATSCVVELSRNILQSGKEFCTLYTDLSNPTSNSIYKKIGYQEVCDSVEYTFEVPEKSG
jgi:ribosomal protein S18 acetylase RimI-like enzyme